MKKEIQPSVKQDQIHDLLFNREVGWQDIIYDLINTEQLEPWDINLIILTDKYLEKIKELEEADFFVSSKVLLAASLLLRIKSEILLNRYIKSIDEILFGKKELIKPTLEKIELEEEIPELIPKSPLPRFRKVTLKELMESLNKAIITENRRIKRKVIHKNPLKENNFFLPKQRFNIKDKITEIYRNLIDLFKGEKKETITYREFVQDNKEEKVFSFLPMLYLEDQKKIWLEQDNPLSEIKIWLRDVFMKKNPDPLEDLKKSLEEYDKQLLAGEIKEEIIEEVGDDGE